MHLVPILLLLIGFVLPATAQEIRTSHCNCTEGGLPSDSTFTFRGRMSAWNGAPTFRIWRVGTNRMLGIRGICLDSLDLGKYHPYMGLELWGDFTVSAVTPQQLGVMQFICIRSIRHPFLRDQTK